MGEKSKFTPQTASPIFPSCMLTGQLSTPVLESTPFLCVVFFFLVLPQLYQPSLAERSSPLCTEKS